MTAFSLQPLAEAAGEDVVSLELAKAQLRIVADEHEDGLIAILRDAAIDAIEQYTMRRLSPSVIRWTGSLGACLAMGVTPVRDVTSITYLDSAGASQTLSPSLYRINQQRHIVPAPGATWPSDAEPGTVEVELTAGYGLVGAETLPIPRALISAVLLTLGNLFENREAVVIGTIANELPHGVKALCEPYRDPVVG